MNKTSSHHVLKLKVSSYEYNHYRLRFYGSFLFGVLIRLRQRNLIKLFNKISAFKQNPPKSIASPEKTVHEYSVL